MQNLETFIQNGAITPLDQTLLDELSTADVNVRSAAIGKTQSSPFFGHIRGTAHAVTPCAFPLDGKLVPIHDFTFDFRVYSPDRHGPGLSNQMLSSSLICPDEYANDIASKIVIEAAPYGSKAFWLHTPDASLTEDDAAMRAFIKNVQAVSRRHSWIDVIKRRCHA